MKIDVNAHLITQKFIDAFARRVGGLANIASIRSHEIRIRDVRYRQEAGDDEPLPRLWDT